jgi:hypothetical protein
LLVVLGGLISIQGRCPTAEPSIPARFKGNGVLTADL